MSANNMMGLLPLFLIFIVFYFMVFRPQQTKQKEHQRMVSSLEKGDKVVTSGGMHGLVTGLKEKTVYLKIADNVRIEINRTGISAVEKGPKA
ncbi:MAG: preprotein translocase subunit YajC [Candidatus Omnitrophica bacterium]|nr:preprotein translocase subunit YajC [Candidatus Omnitrophota bacterium]